MQTRLEILCPQNYLLSAGILTLKTIILNVLKIGQWGVPSFMCFYDVRKRFETVVNDLHYVQVRACRSNERLGLIFTVDCKKIVHVWFIMFYFPGCRCCWWGAGSRFLWPLISTLNHFLHQTSSAESVACFKLLQVNSPLTLPAPVSSDLKYLIINNQIFNLVFIFGV